ncbi:MAG: tetratricopeptide repeat protein [Polyangiaceae bacterium]|nr:tetratricopeptide repeat protein [Polyangiaceae bacterium]MCW5789075.1 tetratricopeptide repeat protein [Polyangiaceae bacterium]
MDLDTRALLLRQLYLSQMESRAFTEALDTALQAVATGVMPDVARQDAARACLGLGDQRRAVDHLRIASRVCPASRRAFHLWTLGSSLYLAEDYVSAVGALTRAARWGTRDKPLYQAQLGLARWRAGQLATSELAALFDALELAPCGRGYGQFVLGELGHALGQTSVARRYLTAFVERAGGGRVALQVALEAELRRAKHILSELA